MGHVQERAAGITVEKTRTEVGKPFRGHRGVAHPERVQRGLEGAVGVEGTGLRGLWKANVVVLGGRLRIWGPGEQCQG